MLRPGATEEEIAALEARLGIPLPPSYRSFLAISNGSWASAGWGLLDVSEPSDAENGRPLGFLDTTRVGWLRDRDRQGLDIWAYTDYGESAWDEGPAHYAFRRWIPEVEYLDHERKQDGADSKKGHARHALQVSAEIHGRILLNPLVVDAEGEWEAWDSGAGDPGTFRYRSFASMLAAHIASLERDADEPSPAFVHATSIFEDGSQSALDRANAAFQLVGEGQDGAVVETLVAILDDESEAFDARHAAARVLGRIDDPRVVAALIRAVEGEDERIAWAALQPIAARDEPEARRAALAMLTAPDVPDHVIGLMSRSTRETVWQAWQATGDPRLLAKLAYCADPRAVEPLAKALVDPGLAAEHRASLIQYATLPGDDSVVPALLAAVELQDVRLETIGIALARLGARDEAAAVLGRALREQREISGWAAPELGWLGTPAARAELLAYFRSRPTGDVADALGWYEDPEVAEALLAAAGEPELHRWVIDAFEKMRGRAARDALAKLAQRGDLLAARALARLGDERALPMLLEHLVSDDDALAFEGADGLRDLRSPEAAPALLAIVEGGADDDDVVACAAHALVSMRAPEAAAAVEVLGRSASPELRRLAELWG